MSSPPLYPILAAIGLTSGIVAHRVRLSISGSLARHLLLAPALEGMALLPGFIVVGLLATQFIPSHPLTEAMPLWATFVGTYAGGRFAAHTWHRTRSARRETALPFEHWFELMRTNPAQARQFLSAYLIQSQQAGADPRAELSGACASLERTHAGEPMLHGALTMLRTEITRLEQEQARLPTRAV